MKKNKIKFSIKKKEDLQKMTQEELLKYTESLTDYCYKIIKPKKDSSNSSIAHQRKLINLKEIKL